MDHRNNFDLLRLLAALQVVFMHVTGHMHFSPTGPLYVLLSSFPGVACFFVISGFLITDSYLRSSVGSYFAKRALRIYPALVVNILVLELAVDLTGGLKPDTDPRQLAGFLAIYCATSSGYIAQQLLNFHPAVQGWFFSEYPSGVLWTLTVELSFYLVLPVILEVYKHSARAGFTLLAIVTASSFALACQFNDAFSARTDVQILGETIPGFFWIFAFGVAARLTWPVAKNLFESRLAIWLGVYVATIVATYFVYGYADLNYKSDLTIWSTTRTILLAGTVLSAAFTFRGAARVLHKHDLSYSIYLYHPLVVGALASFGFSSPEFIWPSVIAGTLTIAWFSWQYIERPPQRLKDWIAGRPSAASPASLRIR